VGTIFPFLKGFVVLPKPLKLEVFELFKRKLVPSDNKEVISQLSKEVTEKMNVAVTDIFKQYLG